MYRETLFDAAGTLRADYESLDWTRTPLGAPSDWSPTLRTTVDLVLRTRFPVTLLWGPELVLVYNEAYVPLIADKHPEALGRRAQDVFPEAWDVIGPMLRSVYGGGASTLDQDLLLPLQRRGRLDESYFDFAYSAVRSPDGLIEGVIDICAETTGKVIGARRLRTLTALHELIGRSEDAAELRRAAIELLAADTLDFPRVELGTGAAAMTGALARIPCGPADLTLVVELDEQTSDEAHLTFLRLVAFTLGQALDRLQARDVERDEATLRRLMSEALQRSLLTRPAGLDEAFVATRYEPSADLVQVGGDWHDAFRLPDGSVALVIGDVSGHDRLAAAAMAQVRSMTRTLAVTVGEPPGAVLSALDGVMQALAMDVYASAVFARLEPHGDGHRLRWSNAGHPPPVLVAPDGTTSVLERPSDLMLGVSTPSRSDHELDLAPGSSLLLFTDGLIERRHVSLDDQLDALCELVAGQAGLPAYTLADRVLKRFGRDCEDDVAILVVST